MFNEAMRADNSTMLGNDTVYFRWVGNSKKLVTVTLYDSKGIVHAICTLKSVDGKYFIPYHGDISNSIMRGKDSNARHWGPKQNETYTRLHDKLAQEIAQWLQANGFTTSDGYLFEYDELTPEERTKKLVQELHLDSPAQEPAPAPAPQESEPAQEIASDLAQELAPASIQGYSVMLLVGAYIVKRIGADTQALAQEIASVNLGVWLLMPYVQKNTLYQVDRVMIEDSGNCIVFEKSLKDLGKRPGAPRPSFTDTPAQESEPAPAQVSACRCFNPNPLTCNQLKLGYTDCAPCSCPCHTPAQEIAPAQEIDTVFFSHLGYAPGLISFQVPFTIKFDTSRLSSYRGHSASFFVWARNSTQAKQIVERALRGTYANVDSVSFDRTYKCEPGRRYRGRYISEHTNVETGQEREPAQEPAPALPSHTAQVIASDLAQEIAPTYDKNRAYTQALSLALAPAPDCSYYGCTFPASIRLMFTSGMRACYCNTHGAIFDTEIIEESESIDNAITRAVQATLDALKQK